MSTDSSGVPWQGRNLTPQPFAGDDGRPDPNLARVLAERDAGAASEAEAAAALAAARVLVPVVAELGQEHPLPDHARGDAGAQMSVPLLAGPSGIRALPVFTGTESMAAWDPSARPVPVEASRAATSAVDEGCLTMVLDVAGPHPFVVRRPVLWAIAQGRPWRAPEQDEELAEAVRSALSEVVEVEAVRLERGRGSELAVVPALRPGLDAGQLQAVVQRVRELLAGISLLAERAESVELRPVST